MAQRKPKPPAKKGDPAKKRKAAPKQPDVTRIMLPYGDNDGISILLDEASVQDRYASETFSYDVVETLTAGMNAHEWVSWGTHQGGDCLGVLIVGGAASKKELAGNGIVSSLDGGLLRTTGALLLSDWAAVTFACHYRKKAEGSRLTVPAGLYRVTVHRSYGAEQPNDGSGPSPLHLISLEPISEQTKHEPFTAVPGADGWF